MTQGENKETVTQGETKESGFCGFSCHTNYIGQRFAKLLMPRFMTRQD